MGCFASKEQHAEDVIPFEEERAAMPFEDERAAMGAATPAAPEPAAVDLTERSRERASLAHDERNNAYREISTPQWPNRAARSLDSCLPVAIDYVEPRGVKLGHTGPVGWDVFKSTKDRSKFIIPHARTILLTTSTESALLVLSSNGVHTISSNRIELFFPRIHLHDAIAYRASLAVMVEDGSKIKHSIVSTNWGANRRAAFIHLMFEVEKRLDAFLSSSLNHVPVPKNDGIIRPPPRVVQLRKNSASSGTSSTRPVAPKRSKPHVSSPPTYRGQIWRQIGAPQYYHIPQRPHMTFVYHNPAATRESPVSYPLPDARKLPAYSPGSVCYSSPEARKLPIYSHDYRYDWRINDPDWSPPDNFGLGRFTQLPRRPVRPRSNSDVLQETIRHRKARSKPQNLRPHREPMIMENDYYYTQDLSNARIGDIVEDSREGGLKNRPNPRHHREPMIFEKDYYYAQDRSDERVGDIENAPKESLNPRHHGNPTIVKVDDDPENLSNESIYEDSESVLQESLNPRHHGIVEYAEDVSSDNSSGDIFYEDDESVLQESSLNPHHHHGKPFIVDETEDVSSDSSSSGDIYEDSESVLKKSPIVRVKEV
ncbi:hypothetical protein AC578_8941 [Pseudocercospora eumusae]|uniref:Uncharacterized protein n=1 Tax=Pseudocercospora eumusae TaxID=321146 RepID=A0A139HN24_9PEZI|nr:hypothetical protein AC578_8941 [Pseudocercospora eumusae]